MTEKLYIKKQKPVKAVQWNNPDDHKLVTCLGKTDSGFLIGYFEYRNKPVTISSGYYIVETENEYNEVDYFAMSEQEFKSTYSLLDSTPFVSNRLCPICNTRLIETNGFFNCPNKCFLNITEGERSYYNNFFKSIKCVMNNLNVERKIDLPFNSTKRVECIVQNDDIRSIQEVSKELNLLYDVIDNKISFIPLSITNKIFNEFCEQAKSINFNRFYVFKNEFNKIKILHSNNNDDVVAIVRFETDRFYLDFNNHNTIYDCANINTVLQYFREIEDRNITEKQIKDIAIKFNENKNKIQTLFKDHKCNLNVLESYAGVYPFDMIEIFVTLGNNLKDFEQRYKAFISKPN